MKKTIIILIALVLVLIFFAEGLAVPLQKPLVPAAAKWVVHFDMQKYTTSRLHTELLNQEFMGNLHKKTEKISMMFGIDPFKDIKSIILYGLGVDEKETVICVSGNFTEDQIITQIKNIDTPNEAPYHQYTIYSGEPSKKSGKSSEFLAFPKKGLAYFAQSEKAIKTALDVAAGKGQDISASPLKSLLDKAPSGAILTAVVENIAALAKQTKPVILTKMGNALFTFAEKQEDLAFNLNVSTQTPEDAKNMEQILQGLIALVKMQKEDIPVDVKLPEDLFVQTEGSTVRMGFTYPVDYIIKLIAEKGKLPHLSFMDEFSPLS